MPRTCQVLTTFIIEKLRTCCPRMRKELRLPAVIAQNLDVFLKLAMLEDNSHFRNIQDDEHTS